MLPAFVILPHLLGYSLLCLLPALTHCLSCDYGTVLTWIYLILGCLKFATNNLILTKLHMDPNSVDSAFFKVFG